MKTPFHLLLLLVTLAAATLTPHVVYSAEKIKIAVLAFRPKPQTQAQWQPLEHVLEKVMPAYDFEVEALGYDELDAATASRQVDFILTNPAHYVKLQYFGSVSAPLATLALNEDGHRLSVFGGVIFCRATQANVNVLADVEGKTVAVVGENSFGGYQVQAYALQQIGLKLPQDAKTLVTGYPQDNVVESVLTGRAEIGFLRTGVLEAMVREGKLDMRQIKIINPQDLPDFPLQVSTRLYPEWVFTSVPNIDENLARRIVAALFTLEEHDAVTKAMGINGFVVPADYKPVVDLLKKQRVAPFNVAPEFTWQDILARYRWQVLLGLMAFGLIAFQSVRLWLIKRVLESNHRILQQQKQELQDSESKLFLILESVDAYIYLKDQQGRYLFANRRVRELFGYSMEEIVGYSDDKFFDANTTLQLKINDRLILEDGATLKTEETNLNIRDGRTSTYLSIKLPLRNASGEIYALCGISTDISERKQAEEALQLSASVFSHAREGIVITDAQAIIIDVNDAYVRITGYARDELIGQNPRMLSSGRQDKTFYAAMWQDLIKEGHWTGEIWNRHKNGEVYAEMKTISAVRDSKGNVKNYLALGTDITPLKAHAKQLEHIAHFDALTNLPNRVLLADRLHQAMMQAQRRGRLLAVAFLDLDGFKAINDGYGHDAGDQLLIAVASRMKQTLRDGDTLSRIGGDEFVAVLLDLADVEASIPMLSRLLAAAAEPVQVAGTTLQVSASLGVTFFPQVDDIDADQLQRQADQAMYQAKQAGKNRYYIFDAEQDSSVRTLHESLDRIRRALVENEFVLYYQPKVNLRTGDIVGAEALIRWQHPEKGILPPAVFLPVIEDHSLAVDIGEWVIDSALMQMRSWRAVGLDIPVSVNIGARQLQQVDFVERLCEILARHPEISPTNLEFELLETSALEDIMQVSQTINRCLELGVKFALDDFGTGYSSLSYLKRLPIHMLKIDQSFVRDMLDDSDDLAILEGIVGLATAFQRQVIAEGVETVEHGSVLLQLGCELAQGYGIARPMPAYDMPDWVLQWRPDAAWLNQPALNRVDLPVLFAIAEHRAWTMAVVRYLKGERVAAPQHDHLACHLGQWLLGHGATTHGAREGFATIDLLHQQAHQLAENLCALKEQGHSAAALDGIDELNRLRDDLLLRLNVLLQN